MTKKAKHGLLCAIMASVLLGGCSSSTYPPPSFEKKVDVSKPGVLYEGNFTVPYNGSFAPMKFELGFPHTSYELVLQFADTVQGRLEIEEKEYFNDTATLDSSHVSLMKAVGSWGDSDYIGKLSEEQLKAHVRPMIYPGAPIRLKITMTPLAGTRKPIEYKTGKDYGTTRRVTLNPEQPLEITLDLSAFAQHGNRGISSPLDKLLLYFQNLELHGTYHLRIENLDPVILPEGIETTLIQREGHIAK